MTRGDPLLQNPGKYLNSSAILSSVIDRQRDRPNSQVLNKGLDLLSKKGATAIILAEDDLLGYIVPLCNNHVFDALNPEGMTSRSEFAIRHQKG
jgi:hypothetical protein